MTDDWYPAKTAPKDDDGLIIFGRNNKTGEARFVFFEAETRLGAARRGPNVREGFWRRFAVTEEGSTEFAFDEWQYAPKFRSSGAQREVEGTRKVNRRK